MRAQARSRLFYVMPGETQLSVIEDVVIAEDNPEVPDAQLTEASHDWMRALASSTLIAGTTDATPEELTGKKTP